MRQKGIHNIEAKIALHLHARPASASLVRRISGIASPARPKDPTPPDRYRLPCREQVLSVTDKPDNLTDVTFQF